MGVATLRRQVARMRADLARTTAPATPLLTRLRQEPARVMIEARTPADPWQAELLRSRSRRTLLLCGRQCGKSTVAAALALLTALLTDRSLVLLLSPSLRQSGELFRKVAGLYGDLGRPVATVSPRDNALRLELANGSRVVSLPGTEGTIRGYSGVRLLIVDEASRVPDPLYRTVRPMLATSGGMLVALTTPFGKRGWFYEAWSGRAAWHRVMVRASECPRIPAEFLAEERQALGERWYNQEYDCSFEDVIGAVFSQADIDAALTDDVAPLTL